MAYKIKYRGTVEKCKVKLLSGHMEAYQERLRKLEGKSVEITICAETKPNSRPQQKYFRGVVVHDIALEMGEKDERAFEIIQAQFFCYEDSKGRKYIRSTALGEWTTAEWEAKVQEIRQWAGEYLGLVIPLPNDVDVG